MRWVTQLTILVVFVAVCTFLDSIWVRAFFASRHYEYSKWSSFQG